MVCRPNFESYLQKATYYEEELDDADDPADVGLNLTIGKWVLYK